MAYRLVYTAHAVRDLAKLDPAVRDRLRQALEKLTQDPFRQAHKVADPALGMYRFRTGDWRVICDIHENCIVVLRVGHRRESYRG